MSGLKTILFFPMSASHLDDISQVSATKFAQIGKKMPDLRQFSILKNVNFEPFRRFFEKQNCRKSAIFYPVRANFVALSLKMSSKCDAPIEKNTKLPEDVFLETLKIVRAQNSFFAITLSNFIGFA